MHEEKRMEEMENQQFYPTVDLQTGLLFNRSFFKKVDEILQTARDEKYVLAVVDIEHFRLFNIVYGGTYGDRFIEYVADCIKKLQSRYGYFAGYMGGDNFVLLLKDNPEAAVKDLEEEILCEMRKYNAQVKFYPVFGLYAIDDITMPSATMYDRAAIALSGTSGKFAKRICWYESSMEEKMKEELSLLSEIQVALQKEEFTFYAQPQCDISTGKIVGAESLVRWQHGTKGMISPGVFVPVMEKNGIISELDKYVWKKVCQWLRSWIDRGYRPVPISINVSRIDIASMDVPAYLTELLRTYDLSAKLLKVEITESAYIEDDEEIVNVGKQLQEAGFIVMMDDFGSGYSSLNMLKNVSVDVIKLDMRFLDIQEKDEDKGISILESVVSMARMMGLPIIAEGVETQKQEKFLFEMGCRYIQGYYCYKPLPLEQYEELLSDERRLDFGGILCKQVGNLSVRELFNNSLFTDAMVNNMLGAMAFYEVYDNKVEITRVNEQYYQLTGIDVTTDCDTKVGSHVTDDDRPKFLGIFEKAYKDIDNGASGTVHYIRTDGKVLWVYCKIFFLRENAGRRMYYGSVVDLTQLEKKQKAQKLSAANKELDDMVKNRQAQLEYYYGRLSFGYGVSKVIVDESDKPVDYEIVYANKEMQRIGGGSTEGFCSLLNRLFEGKRDEFFNKIYQAAYMGKREVFSAYSSVHNMYLRLQLDQYDYGYASCIVQDVTHMQLYEGVLNSILTDYREIYFLHLQDDYCRMIYPDNGSVLERGNYEELINRHFGMGKILHNNEQDVREKLSLENIRSELQNKDSIEYRYRRSSPDSEDEWCVTTIMVSERENGIPKIAIVTVRSIEGLLREEEQKLQQNMAEALANMSDGFFVYNEKDEEILYANPQILRIFGCTSREEFMELVGGTFRGMLHPDDVNRVEAEIDEQIRKSDENMDYVRYRIVRKDGQERWLDDWGHLENSDGYGDSDLFYVFVADITDKITKSEKEKIINISRHYNENC